MPSQRPRPRPKRILLALGLLLVLVLLLEMNRWLPGGWPGGGGESGFKPLAVAPGADPTRLEPPAEPSPDWKPAQGVRLEVLGPEGRAPEGWRAGLGGRGSLDAPAKGGSTLVLGGADLVEQGLRVTYPGGQVRHQPPRGLPLLPTWRVYLPTPRPPPLVQPEGLKVEVRDAATGAPLAGARVFGPARPTPILTDAQGRATVPGLLERAELRVTQEGWFDALVVGHAGAAAPLSVRLSPQHRLTLVARDPLDGQPAPFQAARIEDAEGRELWRSDPGGPAQATSIQAVLPGERRAGARLLVEAAGRPLTDVALPEADGDVALAPRGRLLTLTLRGTDGRGVAGRAATVRLAGAAGGAAPEREAAGREQRVRPGADGTLAVAVPDGQAATVVVEAEGLAPAVLEVAPGDTAGSRELTLEPGVRVPVEVLDVRGRPVREAEVVGYAEVGGVLVEVRARTDAEGRTRLPPLPAGAVELYAKSPGKAWNGLSVTASPAMGTQELRLLPGAALRLVVESPLGAPLAGVHVLLTPADDGAPDRRPPQSPWRTDAQGVLIVEDLPLRPYRVGLALPGHVEETLFDVRPGAVTYFATLVERAP